MITIPFTKVHGCGNDFVLICIGELDTAQRQTLAASIRSDWARKVCDRRTGIGADGILILDRTEGVRTASITNADGTDGGMCGNGLRCIACYITEHESHPEGKPIIVRMGERDTRLSVTSTDPFRCSLNFGTVTVGRSSPETVPQTPLDSDPQDQPIALAWVGNPHAIVFAPDWTGHEQRLADASKSLRGSDRFPHGVNVTLASVQSSDLIIAATDERGVGPTQACASGAAATAACAHAMGLAANSVTIRMPGGDLEVSLAKTDRSTDFHATLTGTAEIVYRGQIPLPVSQAGA